MQKIKLSVLFFWLSTALLAQSTSQLWQEIQEPAQPAAQRMIFPKEYRVLKLQAEAMLQFLDGAPDESVANAGVSTYTLQLPSPDGRMESFRLCESPVMAPGLAQRFPQIKTYLGKGVDNPTALVRLDYTPHGFHAMVLAGEDTYFIDPYYHLLDNGTYLSYYKRDFQTSKEFACQTEGRELPDGLPGEPLGRVGEELRTYRLALACTGEYAQFHGGTVIQALAAMVTSMNRINGVYERDFSVRMELVDSNHLIVFTNPSTDPYSGGNSLGQNQSAVDQFIGSANYDVGHLFDTGSGGVAFLRAICSTANKARGYTGLTPPVGDPFDIDYAAHEMGHQFGGNHTFNSCGGNRNADTAYEPGSGVTIMAYAGICGGQNIASNSIDHFHNGSLAEMTPYIVSGSANVCAERTPTGNTPPLAEAGPNGQFIPISTPFELTGSAVDLEGDSLTYCWEQIDLGPDVSFNSPQGNAPLFRSFPPTTDSTRVFPRISAIVNNTNSLAEVLPTYTRGLTFRLTVRDNFGFGGGVDWDTRILQATDEAGPFLVLSQNDPTTWTAGTFQNIEWDVANTDQSPVNADQVNIYLSMDGGFTYPMLLLEGAPNNGQALIQVPDTLQGNQFRVKVKAANNVFFDINNRNITIQPPSAPGITAAVAQPSQLACAGQTLEFELLLAPLLDYEGELTVSVDGLPDGVEVGFESPLMAPSQSTVSISGLSGLASGNYPFQLIVTGDSAADTVDLNMEVYAQAPQDIVLLLPGEGEPGISIEPELSWEAHPDAFAYEVEVSLDPGFSSIYYSESDITGTSLQLPVTLPDSTFVYWRVRGENPGCGTGPFTESFFETERIMCQVFTTPQLPASLGGSVPFVISRIAVEEDVIVRDVNILNIQGTHEPLTDLNFRLSSPEGPIIDLSTQDCSANTFDFSLNDESPLPIPCPYNNGGSYRPEEALSIYDGQSAQGEWRLILFKSERNGSLDNWELELCFPMPVTGVRDARKPVQQLKAYPNPASQELNVEIPRGLEAGARLNISSAAGQLLAQHAVRAASGTEAVDINGLPPGLYFLQLFSSEGQLVGNSRFVKIGAP